jgi:putative DNA primase/helicase
VADGFEDIRGLGEFQENERRNSQVLTEELAAGEFVLRHTGKLLYCNDHGAWFVWTGAHWKLERTGLAFDEARKVAHDLSEAEVTKTQIMARKTGFVSGIERFARHDRVFSVTSDGWDRDPFRLGTPEGTVDLRTGMLIAADPAHRITKITGAGPAPKPTCPLWISFLEQSTDNDQELIRFLRQWCGYALTGDTREHALVFVYGPGGNGKSVFLNTVTAIMGDYATTAAMDTFTASQSDKHPTDLAMLRGARLVTASETEEGRAWAEARIKQMTGGDPISARFMRQDFFTFVPQFKLTIIGNHKPVLQNVDDAARRRFNIVPFTRKPEKPDRALEATLKAEWPGILRWMIEGCLDWQQHGLLRPASVVAATETYFSDQDLFGQWIEDECDAEPGNEFKSDTVTRLFESWSEFANRAAERPGNKKTFAEAMQRRGFTAARGHAGVRLYRGLRLNVVADHG